MVETKRSGTQGEIPSYNYSVNEFYLNYHLVANELFFQRIKLIGLYVTTAVVLEPPDRKNRFKEVAYSHLSPNQKERVKRRMIDAHKENGIYRFPEDSPEYQHWMNPVPEDSYDRLWQRDAYGAIVMIGQKVLKGPLLPSHERLNDRGPDKPPIESVDPDFVERLDKWWYDPKNGPKVNQMQDSAELAHEVLFSDLAKDLSTVWKAVSDVDMRKIAIRDFYDNELACELLQKIFKREGRKVTPSVWRLMDSMHPKRIGADEGPISQNRDLIYEILREAIKTECRKYNLPLPFGMEYEIAA